MPGARQARATTQVDRRRKSVLFRTQPLSGAGSGAAGAGKTFWRDLRIAGAVSAPAAVTLFGAVGCGNQPRAGVRTPPAPMPAGRGRPRRSTPRGAGDPADHRQPRHQRRKQRPRWSIQPTRDGDAATASPVRVHPGGYTRTKFTVRSIAAQGADKAVAQVDVASSAPPRRR